MLRDAEAAKRTKHQRAEYLEACVYIRRLVLVCSTQLVLAFSLFRICTHFIWCVLLKKNPSSPVAPWLPVVF